MVRVVVDDAMFPLRADKLEKTETEFAHRTVAVSVLAANYCRQKKNVFLIPGIVVKKLV